ncbi:hypothetical protein QBC44DRAFT_393385 [Cladorrhinum sp. PSN332]|nr:hypothetical protein QBC44DRAFT_393385 [Cladorrhinum sp. PSN332]
MQAQVRGACGCIPEIIVHGGWVGRARTVGVGEAQTDFCQPKFFFSSGLPAALKLVSSVHRQFVVRGNGCQTEVKQSVQKRQARPGSGLRAIVKCIVVSNLSQRTQAPRLETSDTAPSSIPYGGYSSSKSICLRVPAKGCGGYLISPSCRTQSLLFQPTHAREAQVGLIHPNPKSKDAPHTPPSTAQSTRHESPKVTTPSPRLPRLQGSRAPSGLPKYRPAVRALVPAHERGLGRTPFLSQGSRRVNSQPLARPGLDLHAHPGSWILDLDPDNLGPGPTGS